jgi:hypothetical protein
MITPSFSLTATERVLPRLALDFTIASLDPRITFTRTGNTATVVNSSGYVTPINADLPRFDYDPIALTCKGLLIEESRTNSLLYSEEFNLWSQSGTVNVTQNAATSPGNTLTADEIIGTTTSSNRRFQTLALTSGVAYSYSIFAKETSGSQPGFRILNAASSIVMRLDILFTSGVPAFVNTTGATNPKIENYGNGWYKISGTYTAAATENHFITVYPDRSGTQKTVYVWGAQLEAGAFATSYIPTVASQVTRSADVATMTGTNFSDWFNATEGTFTFQGVNYDISTTKVILDATDGTLDERIQLSTAVNKYFMADGGSTQANFGTGTITANVAYKMVAAYKLNDLAFALNGAATQTDNTATLPTLNQMTIGTRAVFVNINQYSGWLQKLNYYPQRLINAEVQAFSK